MKILQLCCFTNLWGTSHEVYSIDLRLKRNIFDYPWNYGKNFDLVCAAPPCDQYTKANNQNWLPDPVLFNAVTAKCLQICQSSGLIWFLENPPGRIETFFPALTPFRIKTWNGNVTKKEYVIYSNSLMLFPVNHRYQGTGTISNLTKKQRERWQPDFIQDVMQALDLS
ncbi:MAG: hypothetical protein IMZ70_02255 [Candidatus Atribacteria bacterium]|nr:hypothetical protein [Candidatus Atribacteria bacterium]